VKRVLVLEDNEANSYLMRFMLEKGGCDVIDAGEGTVGVELAQVE